MSTETQILPPPRTFALANGQIHFRQCLRTARDFRRQFERSMTYGLRTKLGLSRADIVAIVGRVRELVASENSAWSALTPAVRAAAVTFDAAIDIHNLEHRHDYTREVAIRALAAGRPAFADATRYGHAFVSILSEGAERQWSDDSRETVFEAFVAAIVRDARFGERIIPVNSAGEALLRNARAAVAMRSVKAAA